VAFLILELWNWDGTLERIYHNALRGGAQGGREASPTVAIIDTQTAKGAQKGGSWLDPSGYDAGKKIKGRKRHILVDALGLLLNVVALGNLLVEPFSASARRDM
jgi:putative transposase